MFKSWLLVGSMFIASSALAHDHSPSPSSSPTESPSVSPSPTPTPACSDADLAAHLTCLASCDADAAPACSSQGAISHFGAFLAQASASCSFPTVDTKREYSKLEELVHSLRKVGALSASDAKLIRKNIKICRRSLSRHGESHARNRH